MLSAILHLGNIAFADNQREVAQLVDTNSLMIAAELLGVEPEKLRLGILCPRIKAGNEWITKALSTHKAMASRDALAKVTITSLSLYLSYTHTHN